MVTLSLFDTLLALHCEDLMLELVLKFLVAGRHVPAGHRLKVNRSDGYATAVDHFLELTPEVMKKTLAFADIDNGNRSNSSAVNNQSPQASWSKTIGANWNHYGLNNATDSLYANYRAYLFDARQKIAQCQIACTRWSTGYRLQSNQATATSESRNEKRLELIRDFLDEFTGGTEEADSSDRSATSNGTVSGKQLDSLQSLGESSGYESFKYRVEDDSSGEERTVEQTTAPVASAHSVWPNAGVSSWKMSSRRTNDSEYEFDYADDVFAQETISLGKYF